MADFEYISEAHAAPDKSGPTPPKDFSYHFSRVTAARSESSVKQFYKYFQIPGIGNLAGGTSQSSGSADTEELTTLRRASECIFLRRCFSSNMQRNPITD